MAWAYMGASQVSSLIFIDDATHDGSNRMNLQKYSVFQLTEKSSKVIGRNFIMQKEKKKNQHHIVMK